MYSEPVPRGVSVGVVLGRLLVDVEAGGAMVVVCDDEPIARSARTLTTRFY